VYRSVVVWVLFMFSTLGAEDFITEFEYGQMLYQNPRGASCVSCHGETGEGRPIGEYRTRHGEKVTLNGPDIRHATLEAVRRSVREGKGVMPRYFLTEDEIRTIYTYLQKVNGQKKGKISALFSKEDQQSIPSSK